eukprot:TRINITY_DN1725_c0_g1_i20.p1 TRINITY_DN1725_c0_g1~~TRINITY_DN1725_c0_g1_i20.p1  ORF type:complete len:314 (+),score=64.37 TRINITY_DN1725_c0_g1_i20:556-1497(+)
MERLLAAGSDGERDDAFKAAAPTNAARPVAAMTGAHKELSSLLKAVQRTLHEKDLEFRSKEVNPGLSGVRRFWIVESAEQVAAEIKQRYTFFKSKVPATYDFKTMYSNLDQGLLRKGLGRAIREAFEHAGKELVINKSGSSFADAEDDDKVYSLSMVEELVEFVVDNAYVEQGGRALRQVRGIPMGGNASPDIANLYCYSVEADYIDGLIENKDWGRLKELCSAARYIDDFLVWDTTPPPEELYGMSYAKTSDNDDDVPFIGMRIRTERHETPKNNWVRLKAANWKFKPTRFTHGHTAAPSTQGPGILKGMMQ